MYFFDASMYKVYLDNTIILLNIQSIYIQISYMDQYQGIS